MALRLISAHERHWWDFLTAEIHRTGWGGFLHHFLWEALACYTFPPFLVPKKGKNELLSLILCPAGRAEPPAYQGGRFFLVQWLAVISGQKGLSFVSRSWLGFFSPCRRHFCYFPHFYKRTQVGGPFPEALGPLPMVGNNQINVAEEYSLHGQHLIAILLWNYSSQFWPASELMQQ